MRLYTLKLCAKRQSLTLICFVNELNPDNLQN
jgi:hypothetical protein